MADIFISYKKEDAGRVVRIVEGLRAEGLSVWWDHGITPGAQWDQTIQHQLSIAKVVIAVWSDESVNAPWVKEEASAGKNRGILLPVRIDDVEPPLGFGLIQAADLRGWDGDRNDPHFQHFAAAVRAVLSGEKPVGLEAPRRKRSPMGWILGAVAAAVIVVGAAAGFVYLRGESQVAARSGPEGGDLTAEMRVDAPPGPSGPAPTQAAAPTPQERQAFDQAMAAKTRAAFQSYLVAYPNGAFADRARDILLTCRTETQEVWNPGNASQVYRGVNAEDLQPTEARACAAARRAAAATAETACRAIASNTGYRNGVVRQMTDGPCSCEETPAGVWCTADPTFQCSWEMRVEQPVEICG